MCSNYSKDRRAVYYMAQPLTADLAHFAVITRELVKDARQVFCGETPMEGPDPATFRVLNGPAGCSCDAHYAYSIEKRIVGVDPKPFPAKGECESCNESGVTF